MKLGRNLPQIPVIGLVAIELIVFPTFWIYCMIKIEFKFYNYFNVGEVVVSIQKYF